MFHTKPCMHGEPPPTILHTRRGGRRTSSLHCSTGHEELNPASATPVTAEPAKLLPGKLVGNTVRCCHCKFTLLTCPELEELGDVPYWQVQCAKDQRWTEAPSTKNWRCPPCLHPCEQTAVPHEGCIRRHGNHGDHPALPSTRLASSLSRHHLHDWQSGIDCASIGRLATDDPSMDSGFL